MTPQNKAKHIIERFESGLTIKDCAMICVSEMIDDFERDPDKAEHIWNGAYGATQGAILARWVNQALTRFF